MKSQFRVKRKAPIHRKGIIYIGVSTDSRISVRPENKYHSNGVDAKGPRGLGSSDPKRFQKLLFSAATNMELQWKGRMQGTSMTSIPNRDLDLGPPGQNLGSAPEYEREWRATSFGSEREGRARG